MPLLNFRQYTLDANAWTEIKIDWAAVLSQPTSVSKIWFEFAADIVLCSRPSEDISCRSTPVSSGGIFEVPLSKSLALDGPMSIVWAKAVSGTVTLTLCWIEG